MQIKQRLFGPRIDSIHDYWRVWHKNRNLNRALRNFAQSHMGPFPERETELKPEVIIPCFNQGRFLAAALGSIWYDGDLAITVVNDASTDDTAEQIRQLSGRFEFKPITNEKNLNQSGSLNRAIGESDNNVFIMLNADDALTTYTVSTILAILTKHPDLRLVGGGCVQFSRDATLLINQTYPSSLSDTPEVEIRTPTDVINYRHLNDLNMTMSGSAFVRSASEAVGGFCNFDQRVCSYDDRDFQMRVNALFCVGVIEEPLAFYRVASSVNRSQG